MKRTTMVAVLGVALAPILLLGAPAGSDAQEPAKNASEPAKVNEPMGKSAPQDNDEEIWRLLLRAVAPAKPEITQAAAQELLAMDRERVLAALGRFVQRKDRAHAVMNFVRWYFMDKQAVPIVAEALRQSDGRGLRQAVIIARLMPDPAFVGPLIEHALDSNYRAMGLGPNGSQGESISLFAEATDTLHVITKGKSGLRPVSARGETKEKKEALVSQWREWWQANKDTWQAEPPGNEKPKENPSAAKNAPEKGASEETQPPPKTDPPTGSKPAPAGATAVPPGAKNAPPAIPMRESGELNSAWSEAAARMSDDSKEWKGIQRLLRASTGSAPPAKVDALRLLYDCVRRSEKKIQYVNGAVVLMEAGGPAVVRECLLHPNSDVVASACEALLKFKPKQADQGTVVAGQPNDRDSQAVPFLVYVLQRNNFWQDGSEVATVHFILKQRLVAALLYITDTENRTAPVNVDDEQQVDRVLALARKWAAEKGVEPLEKQRPPKAFPPAEPKPAPARQ